ncbi:hypothetical protein SAMN06265222_108147 [Neorhodopirellula lusitana]|uniref:Transmembrane protein n=1 Tax=Neorhodopirellula lusitana TaxID=445327 RepID=A0ABY1QCQ5_9BACT|nr:hypothetical protein [Neorhodopirellula lusitana]SMP63899.1 hypothetical protein SAMN06265222_108147 [Neorhodopirellula lusitana]
MSRLVFQLLCRAWPRRLICGTLLVVLAVGMIGFPISPQLLAKRAADSSERFPCESCPCGCVTAEFCWDKCCCHSDEEKLRWAEVNGVQPPAFLVDRVAAQKLASGNTVAGPASGASSETTGSPPAASCCCCQSKPESQVCQPAASSSTEAAADESNVAAFRLIQLESVAQCRGIKLIWSLLSEVILPGSGGVVAVSPRVVARMSVIDEMPAEVFLPVDPPVPWSCDCA